MLRQIVSSTNIASIGYEASTSTLEVEFQNGHIYQYYDVPAIIYQGLMTANSKGMYFNRTIKEGGYRFKIIV